MRRFLSSYLAASEAEKELYYEAVAKASSGCQPENSVSYLESTRAAEATAGIASRISKLRQKDINAAKNHMDEFVTDAFATSSRQSITR